MDFVLGTATTLTADLTQKALGAGTPTATSDLTARSSHPNAALTVDGTSKIGVAETDTETGYGGMNLVGDLEAHAKAAGVEREVDLFEVSSQVKPTVTRSSGTLSTKAIARNGGSPLTTTSRFSSSSHTQGQIEGQATADAKKASSLLNVLGEGLPLLTYGTSLTAETDDDAEDVMATTGVYNTQNRPVTEAGLSSNAQVESNLDKVTVALVMKGENIDSLGGTALGAAEGAPEASITLSGTSGATPAVVSGRNEARVEPGINPFVVAQHVDAAVQVNGDYSTSAVATGEKVRTILMEDQETGNGTFDFGIKELVLTIAGQSTDTFSSVEFELWPDTNNDGVEDGARVWSGYATFSLDYNYTLGIYEGDISAGGDEWCECDFVVAPPSGVPSAAFTATLRPESKLQHAVVADTTQDYIFISKYRAEATGGAVPAAAGVYYEKCYAPPVPKEIDLVIHDGQNGRGLLDDQEVSRGAFTVANLNDTDGDGTADVIDTNGVTATSTGTDEVDLMELEIKGPPGGFLDPVTLKVIGSAKLWSTPTKVKADGSSSQVGLDANGEVTFPCDKVPEKLWVEATSASAAVRDIEIKAISGNLEDTVKATGVWVEFVEALHDRGDTLWGDIGTPTKDEIDKLGGKVGLATPSDNYGLRNLIAFKFKALPVGIGTAATNTEFVKFDDARQLEKTVTVTVNDQSRTLPPSPFPTKDDEVNDDPFDDGETNVPTATSFLFAVDAPGLGGALGAPAALPQGTVLKTRFNAREFFRVRFDNIKPSGGTERAPKIDGSRVSPKINWHATHTWIVNNQQKFQRTTGDVNEAPDVNDVKTD